MKTVVMSVSVFWSNTAKRIERKQKLPENLRESERRYDLDWLRVGAFLLLILYHIGMYYVSWGWHVKSGHAPITALELPMKLLNAWRLPLLFLISGIALRYALQKSTHMALLKRRIWIIFLPLLFGMYVVCAPQAWHELAQNGSFSGSVWEFYKGYADWPWSSPEGWPIITPTWNHLWYLLYILVYTIIIVTVSFFVRGRLESKTAPNVSAIGWGIFAIILNISLMLLLFDYVGKPQTLYGDWYNLVVSFLIMVFGYLMAKSGVFWASLKSNRMGLLIASIMFSGLIVFDSSFEFSRRIELSIRIAQGWSVMGALLGWGQVLLNRPSPILNYLSASIFTFYILHQTIIIVVGVPLSQLNLPLAAEMLILMASTFILCWAGYAFVASRIGSSGVLLGARN